MEGHWQPKQDLLVPFKHNVLTRFSFHFRLGHVTIWLWFTLPGKKKVTTEKKKKSHTILLYRLYRWLWHTFSMGLFLQCFCFSQDCFYNLVRLLFPCSVAYIFSSRSCIDVGRFWSLCKAFSRTSHIFSRELQFGLCNDVSSSLNHSFTIWGYWILEKNIDGITWSFSIFR